MRTWATLGRIQAWVYGREKPKKTKLTICTVLASPWTFTDWRPYAGQDAEGSSADGVSALQKCICLYPRASVAHRWHSTAGSGWSRENSFHLAKKSTQLAKVQLSGNRKHENKTAEWGWVRRRCKRQNCRDGNARRPLSAQPRSRLLPLRAARGCGSTDPASRERQFQLSGVVMWGPHKGGRRVGDLQP